MAAAIYRPLNTLPLPGVLKVKLARKGYDTVGDIHSLQASTLVTELEVTEEEAETILKCANEGHETATAVQSTSNVANSGGCTLVELLKREQEMGNIVSFCAKIDEMLGGGVPIGRMTEVCGSPGVGKTQMCMQLAVDATIPEAFGGVGGATIYIDTEGSLVVERLAQIAAAAVEHIKEVAEGAEGEDVESISAASRYTVEHVLKSIYCVRILTHTELLAMVNILPKFVEENPLIKLIIIDSVASPFRNEFTDLGLRNRLLNGMAQKLIKMASEKGLAVVLTNQMTLQQGQKGEGLQRMTPALGESWGHVCTIRIVLYREKGSRYALLYKSPSKKEMCVTYKITEFGLRDVDFPDQEDLLTDCPSEECRLDNSGECEPPKNKKAHVQRH